MINKIFFFFLQNQQKNIRMTKACLPFIFTLFQENFYVHLFTLKSNYVEPMINQCNQKPQHTILHKNLISKQIFPI